MRDADAVAKREREALTERENAPPRLAERDADPGTEVQAGGVGTVVTFRVHATVRSSVWLAAAVSRIVASVALAASSTRSVWFMARVLQPPAMPAAVHEAGGDQQLGIMASRLAKTTEERRVGAPRSSAQTSHALVPPEL